MSTSTFDARSLSIKSTSRAHCVESGPQAYRFTISRLLNSGARLRGYREDLRQSKKARLKKRGRERRRQGRGGKLETAEGA
ncbi:hypothetical protein GJ744_005432 [Endocarpon pusillum]|uniref:Uncharacterized protein n=1 Tax=Endocarpon pusillum TaxID=364733 RepID=A0A8H7E151_9EURO|nr:hypothetical protein GJ744_005432 [Endocarpon pusillum]